MGKPLTAAQIDMRELVAAQIAMGRAAKQLMRMLRSFPDRLDARERAYILDLHADLCRGDAATDNFLFDFERSEHPLTDTVRDTMRDAR